MPRTLLRLFLVFWLLSGLARAAPQDLKDAKAALQAAQQKAAAHQKEAVKAEAKREQDNARAAMLARAQIIAAASLRRIEDQTGAAASALAALQARAQDEAANLQSNVAALASLLPIMERLAARPAAAILANPALPADSVRGILIVQGIAAEIESRAAVIQSQTKALALLQQQMRDQQTRLAAQAAIQKKAEDDLTAQIAGARAAVLADQDAAASETAAALAADQNIKSLQGIMNQLLVRQPQISVQKSAVPMAAGGAPVAGSITRIFGAATIAGPATGMIYRAAPGARVAAPCAGPVVFADHFQSYGLLVILDCGGGYDFVLSGMAALDVAAGQRVARGQPVGQMPQLDPKSPADEPDLYVELRRNGAAVNPAGWLSGGGSG